MPVRVAFAARLRAASSRAVARAVVAAESTTRRVGPSCRDDRARQQREMRAAQHHRVHARIEVREVPLGDGIDCLAFAPALFGQRDENLRCNLGDMGVRAATRGWRA